VVYEDRRRNEGDLGKKDIEPAGMTRQDPGPFDEEYEKDGRLEEDLITLLLPVFRLRQEPPNMNPPRYLRGLLCPPSHILHIFPGLSISYLDQSHPANSSGPFPAS
jgi:hypothetical protein